MGSPGYYKVNVRMFSISVELLGNLPMVHKKQQSLLSKEYPELSTKGTRHLVLMAVM
jgi:hypothetical protein